MLPTAWYAEATIGPRQRGILHRDARPVGSSANVVDTRLQVVTIQGQELMTRDRVTLRLTLTAEYTPGDPASSAHGVADGLREWFQPIVK